jgi:feruloyl esterase
MALVSMAAGFTSPACADTPPKGDSSQAAQCGALAEADFSNVVDAPTQISEAKLVDNPDQLFALTELAVPDETKHVIKRNFASLGPYCRVSGYVIPNVGFELLLPVDHWNGKFLHVGCAGWCGTTRFVALACARHPNYACIGTDMGHTGAGGLWVRKNLQAQVDFSYRATHVATLAGKAIIEHYYATAPKRSYFLGCSTGGYQGMVEAQRFPWDFNGIVAGAPDMDESDLAVRGIWIKQNFLGQDGKPVLNSDEIQLVHEAALAKCDLDDGVKDGIISDPMHCKFDPRELLCKAGKNAQCLSAAQVRAVKNIYGAPVTSRGVQLSSRGVFPGSELSWTEAFESTWGDDYFADTALLTSPGKVWKYTDFDFDHDYARSGSGVLFDDTNPDLRKFKAAGGKLISYQGGNDTLEIPGAIFDYYETVEKTMGGRAATQDFFRLFTIPGMNHCGGGDGVFAFDYLSYMEAWVEQGRAPDVMIGAHVKDLGEYGRYGLKTPLDSNTPVSFTRPVYPYPLHAEYKGSGDPNRAENFRPALPNAATSSKGSP